VKRAALGFRAHSGWTAMVAVALEKESPLVLARRRLHLVELFTYQFRQPYHTAEKMPLDKAREFIAQTEAVARRLAYDAMRGIRQELRKQGYELQRAALLLASGKTLPSLEKILASHPLIHTADGELFREAISHACARCGFPAAGIKERELLGHAAKALRRKPTDLLRRATELGKPFGSPWSQDEKFSTLAAWLALHGASKPKPAV